MRRDVVEADMVADVRPRLDVVLELLLLGFGRLVPDLLAVSSLALGTLAVVASHSFGRAGTGFAAILARHNDLYYHSNNQLDL